MPFDSEAHSTISASELRRRLDRAGYDTVALDGLGQTLGCDLIAVLAAWAPITAGLLMEAKLQERAALPALRSVPVAASAPAATAAALAALTPAAELPIAPVPASAPVTTTAPAPTTAKSPWYRRAWRWLARWLMGDVPLIPRS